MSFLECIDALLEVDILRGKLRLNSYQSGTSILIACLSRPSLLPDRGFLSQTVEFAAQMVRMKHYQLYHQHLLFCRHMKHE